ncbi:hypothetical protein ASE22_17620 [Sphingomonas sp. Root720]|nr:hypothetical protein ASE22_17620 [Sphingomonas sp. Root720]
MRATEADEGLYGRMRVTMLQPGARHNYMQSRFLYAHGALRRLYTDFAMPDTPLARLVHGLVPKEGIRASLARRVVKDVPGHLIRNIPSVRKQNRIGRPAPWPIGRRDLSMSDIFYTQYYSGGHGLRDRIRPDAKIVSDVFTVPSTHKIVNAEVAAFPEWGEHPFDTSLCERYERFTHDMLDDSDALFCPAQSVIDDIESYGAHHAGKCVLVPYASSLAFPAVPQPVPKRILFAGTLTLRKGPHYVKMAAERLARTDPAFRFVFAGGVSDAARRLLEGPNVELLGHLSRDRMVEQFARADVFVLPSLAEGSAGVVLEAMSAALPVVVSRGVGIDFPDGGPGFYVPDRDPDAIAAALVRICDDRPLREHMSREALVRSSAYGLPAWDKRFMASLARLCEGLE